MRRSLSLLSTAAILLLALVNPSLRADDFLPNVEPGKIVVRTIPGYPAIEAEIEGSVEKDWERGFRQGARYVASIENELRWPIVVTFPDWLNQPPQPKARMLVHLILNTQRDFAFPKEKGLAMTDQPTVNVACYALRGAYTLENFKKGLTEIQTYLKQNNLTQNGPPRVLYYSNPAWMPSFWLLQEVQVPILNSSSTSTEPTSSAPAAN